MKPMNSYKQLKTPVLVLGAGGHARVLIDALLLLDIPIIGIVDADIKLKGVQIRGISVLGEDDFVLHYSPHEIMLVNGIGSVKNTRLRKKIFEKFKEKGFRFFSIIHPSAIISTEVFLGEGVQILAGAILQTDSAIGDNTIINTRVVVEHDCQIGSHVHLAPGVVLSGNVSIGDSAHIGTGGIVIQGKMVGSQALVAAGSVVVSDVPNKKVVMGIPAKPVKEFEE